MPTPNPHCQLLFDALEKFTEQAADEAFPSNFRFDPGRSTARILVRDAKCSESIVALSERLREHLATAITGRDKIERRAMEREAKRIEGEAKQEAEEQLDLVWKKPTERKWFRFPFMP